MPKACIHPGHHQLLWFPDSHDEFVTSVLVVIASLSLVYPETPSRRVLACSGDPKSQRACTRKLFQVIQYLPDSL